MGEARSIMIFLIKMMVVACWLEGRSDTYPSKKPLGQYATTTALIIWTEPYIGNFVWQELLNPCF